MTTPWSPKGEVDEILTAKGQRSNVLDLEGSRPAFDILTGTVVMIYAVVDDREGVEYLVLSEDKSHGHRRRSEDLIIGASAVAFSQLYRDRSE